MKLKKFSLKAALNKTGTWQTLYPSNLCNIYFKKLSTEGVKYKDSNRGLMDCDVV